MISYIYINGKMHVPKIHSPMYVDELFHEMLISNLPGTHIKVVSYHQGHQFIYKCSIRDNIWNKKGSH